MRAGNVKNNVFCSPFRYTQGPGVTRDLGKEMTGLGLSGPVLVIASNTPARVLGETWDSTFKAASLEHQVEVFGGECSRVEIDRLAKVAGDLGAATILGAGGGKVIDTARAVANACTLAQHIACVAHAGEEGTNQ